MNAAIAFSLRNVIRDVLAEATEPDPGVIAGMVIARIAHKDRGAALTQAMRTIVREVIREERNRPPEPSNVRTINKTQTGRSAKVSAIREAWKSRLDASLEVSDGWKFLRECTYDDLMFAASKRQEQATQLRSRAREYEAMAEAVRAAGVTKFGDLPVKDQARFLGGAA